MTEPRKVPTWDERFMHLCWHISQWSKDPSSQFGCVIVGPGKEIRSTGFNGFPRGVRENAVRMDHHLETGVPEEKCEAAEAIVLVRWDRPLKYQFIVHAEENAILNAARNGVSLLGCTMYVNGHPCARCAASIIQAGVAEVVFRNPFTDYAERWKTDIMMATVMFKEARVRVRELPETGLAKEEQDETSTSG